MNELIDKIKHSEVNFNENIYTINGSKSIKLDQNLEQINFDLTSCIDISCFRISKISEEISLGKMKCWIYDISKIHNNEIKGNLICFVNYILLLDIDFYHMKKTYLPKIQMVVDFIVEKEYTSLNNITIEDCKEFRGKFTKKSNGKCIFDLLFRFVKTNYNRGYVFENDIWKATEFNLKLQRLKLTNNNINVNFYKVENCNNKNLLKKYLLKKIQYTSLSWTTMFSSVSHLILLLSNIDNKNIIEFKSLDVNNLINRISENYKMNAQNIYYYVLSLDDFFQFLVHEKVININPLTKEDYIVKRKMKRKTSSISEHDLNKIIDLTKLMKIENQIIIYILISCGLRINEIIGLNRNCFSKENNRYWVSYYSSKVSKYSKSQIPEEVYNLGLKYIQQFNDENMKYLFPRKKNKNEFLNQPISIGGKIKEIKMYFDKNSFMSTTNNLYKFKPHDFRHTFATSLMRSGAPIDVISSALSHSSLQMTLAYTEIDLEKQKKNINSFISKMENNDEIVKNLSLSEYTNIEEIKLILNAHSLTNGICIRPTKLGMCSHINKCLSCKSFRTTIDYIDQHKSNLKQLENDLILSYENGWQLNINRIQNDIKCLKRIIKEIEEQQDEVK